MAIERTPFFVPPFVFWRRSRRDGGRDAERRDDAQFKAKLFPGTHRLYLAWTFAVVPEAIWRELGGAARIYVRVSIKGEAFRTAVASGEGVRRFPAPKAIRAAAGIGPNDVVEIAIETDAEPPPIEVPSELRAALRREALVEAFDASSRSCKMAWAGYFGEAKKEDAGIRRAAVACQGIRARKFPGESRRMLGGVGERRRGFRPLVDAFHVVRRAIACGSRSLRRL